MDKYILQGKEFLLFLCQSFFIHSEDVTINCLEGEKNIIFEIHMESGNKAIFIGRNGSVIRSISVVMSILSYQSGKNFILEFLQ